MTPTTPTTAIQPPSYRLDRVPEDEWIEDYYEDYVSEDEAEDYSTKPVPIWLSVCLVIAYIIGGAFIFQVSVAGGRYIMQYFLSYHPIPWRDSILRPIAPVSSVAGGDFATRPRHQCCDLGIT
jgi:hypothetical protein